MPAKPTKKSSNSASPSHTATPSSRRFTIVLTAVAALLIVALVVWKFTTNASVPAEKATTAAPIAAPVAASAGATLPAAAPSAAPVPAADAPSEAAPVAPPPAGGFAATVENKQPAPAKAPAGMVWIPGGEFSMGAQSAESMNEVGMQATKDSRPIHRVYVDGFFMDKTDVTNAEFARFVKATGLRHDRRAQAARGRFSRRAARESRSRRGDLLSAGSHGSAH